MSAISKWVKEVEVGVYPGKELVGFLRVVMTMGYADGWCSGRI